MIPRLAEDEAHRVVALAILVVVLLAVPFLRRALDDRALAPMSLCKDGAHRTPLGVECGEGGGERDGAPLTNAEALLMGIKIDVNRAQAEDLEIVPGIGKKLAARIIADRNERGAFASVDDVARVSGIGPKLVERMKPFVRSEGPRALDHVE
jgi:competence ComEA-like helix-hairpin-helix protein